VGNLAFTGRAPREGRGPGQGGVDEGCSEKQRPCERRFVGTFVPRVRGGSVGRPPHRPLVSGHPAPCRDGPACRKLRTLHRVVAIGAEVQMVRNLETRGRVYNAWPCGAGAELRLLLTVRRSVPIIEIRYGELGSHSWQPSIRHVAFDLCQLPSLVESLRSIMKDAKRFDLSTENYGVGARQRNS